MSSYHTIVTTFHLLNPKSGADNDEELKYKITGQDFIFDLLFIIDTFQPLTATMTAIQGLSVPIWKTPKYIDLLIDFYKNIEIRSVTGLLKVLIFYLAISFLAKLHGKVLILRHKMNLLPNGPKIVEHQRSLMSGLQESLRIALLRPIDLSLT